MERFDQYAYAGRYAHQSLHSLLGRAPTTLEWHLYLDAIDKWLELETPGNSGSGRDIDIND